MSEKFSKSHSLPRILFLFLLSSAAVLCSSEIYRIEAEDLKAGPDWKIGVGHTHSMGKIQTALKPKISLTGVCQLGKSGNYQVWVRTMSLGQHWRIGELLINGKNTGKFGDDRLAPGQKKGSWYWKKLTPLELAAGPVNIEVRSPKGFTRIDCMILTDDPAFTPPEQRKDFEKIKVLVPEIK